jgi:hypothetical protein
MYSMKLSFLRGLGWGGVGARLTVRAGQGRVGQGRAEQGRVEQGDIVGCSSTQATGATRAPTLTSPFLPPPCRLPLGAALPFVLSTTQTPPYRQHHWSKTVLSQSGQILWFPPVCKFVGKRCQEEGDVSKIPHFK